MPLMAFDLMFSIEILKNALHAFTERCVKGITANAKRCQAYAEKSMSIATALNPIIGYAKAAEIVKEAVKNGQSIIETIKKKKVITDEQLKDVLDLKKLTEPGVPK